MVKTIAGEGGGDGIFFKRGKRKRHILACHYRKSRTLSDSATINEIFKEGLGDWVMREKAA